MNISKENIILNSNDNYKANIPSNYVLVGKKKVNNSFFLQDIGLHSDGFATIITLSILLALSSIFVLYLLFGRI